MEKKSIIKTIFVFAIILAIGISIIAMNKFKYSLDYSKNVRLEVYMGKNFEIDDIKSIANEIFSGKEVILQKAGAFQDGISITLREINEEQKEAFVTKLNEKYETELTVEDIEVYYNSNVRGRDLIQLYYIVVGIAGVLILVFFGVRYHSLGTTKVIGAVLGITLLGEILYLTLISIFNVQINNTTIASMIAIILFVFAYLISNYEKRIKVK